MRVPIVVLVVAVLTCGAGAAPILFDFGDADPPLPGWNIVFAEFVTGDTITDAVDANGAPTSVDLALSGTRGLNAAGTTASSVYPSFATSDNAFGSIGLHGGYATPNMSVVLSDLDVNLQYRFVFFASRAGVSDNREAQYTVTGADSDVVYLDAANNIDTTVTTAAITPSASGEISVDITAGPNNSNSLQYYYLGVMEVNAVPEPVTLALLCLGGLAAVRRRR